MVGEKLASKEELLFGRLGDILRNLNDKTFGHLMFKVTKLHTQISKDLSRNYILESSLLRGV